MDIVLTAEDAAKYLTVSVKTLELMRLRGNGPAFTLVGARRIGYRVSALDLYLDARTYWSTAEYKRKS